MYEFFARRCARLTREVRWIGTEVSNLPTFDGLNHLETFLSYFEEIVLVQQRLLALDEAWKETLARWWGTYKKNIVDWMQCLTLMAVRFSKQVEGCEVRYTGQSCPKDHVRGCEEAWRKIHQEQWVHNFINTLDTMPINWYIQLELHLTTSYWYGMTQKFVAIFLFESQYPSVDQALQVLRKNVFEEEPNLPIEQEEDEWTASFQKFQGCYNINADEDDDPRNVNIVETKGQRDVEGSGVELAFIEQPIKIKKVNIGTEQAPKLANVGDYWDDAAIYKIRELLHEYHDLFPTNFTDMKGIKGPHGRDEHPLEARCQASKVETLHIESQI
jgi:hypothetical protein